MQCVFCLKKEQVQEREVREEFEPGVEEVGGGRRRVESLEQLELKLKSALACILEFS